MKKKMMALTLGSILIFSGCSGGIGKPHSSAGPNNDEEWAYGKMDTPLTLRVGFLIPDAKLTSGDTNDNNPVTRYLESLTNIKVVHNWEAKGDDAFWQKVDMAIASNDLPDAMVVDRNQLRKLIDGDMVEDLTDVFAKYGSSLIKDMYDSTDGVAVQDASRNGRMFGLPNVAIEADAPSLLWIRQDWLDKLGLEPPKTIGELEQVARAFIERDPDGDGKRDTVGLTSYKRLVYGGKPAVGGLDTLFSAFHAFPKNWIRGDDGSIQYGSIMEENKSVLYLLSDWYKKGLIDKQFALYNDAADPIIANKCGLFFGPWWMPYWPLSEAVAADTKAEWRAFAFPLDADGKFVTHSAPVTDRYLVVRKGYKHPEAVVKLLNAFTRYERRQDPNAAEVRKLDNFVAETGIQPRAYYPFDLLIDYADAIQKRYSEMQKAFRGEVSPDTLDPGTRQLYDYTIAENESPKKNLDGWKTAKSYEYGVQALVSANMVVVDPVFYGSTPSMEKDWKALQQLENETYLNIIVGDQPVSAFDDFVKKWKEGGGDRITQEVTDAVRDAQK
ncbi:extracellular solute-binding protein [Gorillibacterium massiliense]|uniref:extracellular solute-binding protein n=1 Tax=Gorillibacterium massiliense TaxID=1280390 RepID=UPI0004BBF61F|nr:extracellular solute-binding protein [Gorillibacterium massiliense]